jgi:hypothetical protein
MALHGNRIGAADRYGRIAGLAALLCCSLAGALLPLRPAAGQSAVLDASGIAAGAIGCAPSNNGTGHLECAEYTAGNGLAAVSWQAPPGPNGVPNAPAATEAVGTVDHLALATPAGPPKGVPGCATAADGAGTLICLVEITSGSNVLLQALSFALTQPTPTSSALTTVATLPASDTIGNPGCTNGGNAGQNAPFGPQALCVLVINGALYAVNDTLAAPAAPSFTALSSLGSGFTGTPGCATVQPTATLDFVALCAVRNTGGLLAFAFDAKGVLGSKQLADEPFTGDPSCTPPLDKSLTAICAIAGSDTLRGFAIPYVQGGAFAPGAYQTLGTPADTGKWAGTVGCAPPNDTENAANLVTCTALSSAEAAFVVTFDPRAGTLYGPTGPFFSAASAVDSVPSCIMLNVDPDQITCGATTSNGGTAAFNLPVGRVSPAVQHAILSIFRH